MCFSHLADFSFCLIFNNSYIGLIIIIISSREQFYLYNNTHYLVYIQTHIYIDNEIKKK